MAGAPWYMLAIGIFLIILGFFIAHLGGGGSGTYIDPRMSDKEIVRRMKQPRGNLFAGLMVSLGSLIILISIVWRFVRAFVS